MRNPAEDNHKANHALCLLPCLSATRNLADWCWWGRHGLYSHQGLAQTNQLTNAALPRISLLSFLIQWSDFYQPQRKQTWEELRSYQKATTTAFRKITFDVRSEY